MKKHWSRCEMKKRQQSIGAMTRGMLDDHIISKLISKPDVLAVQTILTWLRHGRTRAEKISKQYVNNLVVNGFVDKSTGKLAGAKDLSDKQMYIYLCRACAGAQGYISKTLK